MPLADELLDHASRLLATSPVKEVDCRRAVSASYYALFHLLSEAAASQVSPPTPSGMSGKIQRLLNHGIMLKAANVFTSQNNFKNFSSKLGVSCVYLPDLAIVAKVFEELQDARHTADYDAVDTKSVIDRSWALDYLKNAKLAFEAWNRVKATDEARLFLVALIFNTDNLTKRI